MAIKAAIRVWKVKTGSPRLLESAIGTMEGQAQEEGAGWPAPFSQRTAAKIDAGLPAGTISLHPVHLALDGFQPLILKVVISAVVVVQEVQDLPNLWKCTISRCHRNVRVSVTAWSPWAFDICIKYSYVDLFCSAAMFVYVGYQVAFRLDIGGGPRDSVAVHEVETLSWSA